MTSIHLKSDLLISLGWLKFRAFLTHVKLDMRRKWLEILVSGSIICSMIFGGYLLLMKGAIFLRLQGEIGGLLLDRIFYLGWSVIFYLLILSNIITAFSTLYRSREVFFLMTLPLPHRQIFSIKFYENLLYSSWAILLLGLPLTLAYGRIKSIPGAEIGLIYVVGLLPFLVISTALGLCLTMVVVYLSKWFRMRAVFFGLGLTFVLLFSLYLHFSQKGVVMTGEFASFRMLNRYLQNLSQVPFPLIPSHWFSQLFVAAAAEDRGQFVFFAGIMLTNALLFHELSRQLAGGLYFRSFQIMEFSGRKTAPVKPDTPFHFRILQKLAPQTRGLIQKDLIQFRRTPQQWIQFLFFGFFIAVYLINLSRFDLKMETLAPFWQRLIYLFNFGFSSFIIAALTSRFVFPLISLEGRGLWVILSSPLRIAKLFRQKFWLAFAVFFTLAEAVSLTSNLFLSRDMPTAVISSIMLLVMSLVLISFSLGFGAVFAQFHESNPLKISSGTGGIITIIASLVYVGLMVGAMGLLLWLIGSGRTSAALWATAGILAPNGLLVYLPLKWGLRVLERTEL
ncbi:MAG: hypothetical protein GXO91_09950 [FCB group bacterium]|nr:hypothetical protein [FCB group bacterium]